MSRFLDPYCDGDNITPEDSQAYARGLCNILVISSVLPSCYLWCPSSNLLSHLLSWYPSSNPFNSNLQGVLLDAVRSMCAAQDFPPRAQYMYENSIHGAKSWPLCCISTTPVLSTITLLHHKWLKRTHEVLIIWISKNLKSWTHIFKFLYNFHTNESLTIQDLPRRFRHQFCFCET